MDCQDPLVVRKLTLRYGKTPVLWEVGFHIPPHALVGIVGPNGAGKSSLLKALLGIIKPVSGEISILGRPYREVKGKVAYVPQRSCVDWDFPINVLDAVLMGRYGKLGVFKWIGKEDRFLAKEALDRVGMLPFANRQISQLSGGQQQRVFLARALVQEASLYLMDEPFAGVDMATEQTLLELFGQLKKEGKTLCIVHHDLTTVKNYFDWVIILNYCLVASGPVAQVFHEENLKRAYGSSACLFAETNKLTQNKTTGL